MEECAFRTYTLGGTSCTGVTACAAYFLPASTLNLQGDVTPLEMHYDVADVGVQDQAQ